MSEYSYQLSHSYAHSLKPHIYDIHYGFRDMCNVTVVNMACINRVASLIHFIDMHHQAMFAHWRSKRRIYYDVL